jgi:hypothetical protein
VAAGIWCHKPGNREGTIGHYLAHIGGTGGTDRLQYIRYTICGLAAR